MDLDETLAGGYALEIAEDFRGPGLDRSRWLPHHLPQWSSTAASAARYELVDGRLHLLIEEDQPPWCPEWDGPTRVSSLQTGVFSGPVGSTVGQHRFHPDAVVREAQRERRLYTPEFGAFALRAAATDDPDCMAALWMIGFEDRPERSGEICICEIFGRNVSPERAAVGMGIHPFGDPDLVDDFEEVPLDLDVRDLHEYAAEWTPDGVTFFVDGAPVKAVAQAPRYPMQLMLGIYAFGDPAPSTGPYPKRFVVDRFEAYRPLEVA
ncbi:MAG TPA: glycoside hydrolase family 16 protein [Actinomycetota bacterium]